MRYKHRQKRAKKGYKNSINHNYSNKETIPKYLIFNI